jgi:hypothetical protein
VVAVVDVSCTVVFVGVVAGVAEDVVDSVVVVVSVVVEPSVATVPVVSDVVASVAVGVVSVGGGGERKSTGTLLPILKRPSITPVTETTRLPASANRCVTTAFAVGSVGLPSPHVKEYSTFGPAGSGGTNAAVNVNSLPAYAGAAGPFKTSRGISPSVTPTPLPYLTVVPAAGSCPTTIPLSGPENFGCRFNCPSTRATSFRFIPNSEGTVEVRGTKMPTCGRFTPIVSFTGGLVCVRFGGPCPNALSATQSTSMMPANAWDRVTMSKYALEFSSSVRKLGRF